MIHKEVDKMSNISHLICVLIASVLMIPKSVCAKEVMVHLNDERILKGELLVVGSSSLLLGGVKMPGKERTPATIRIPYDSIWQVHIMGGSQSVNGAGVGFVLGAVVGAATAPPSTGFLGNMTPLMAVSCGGLGAAVGWGVGSLFTSDDIRVTAGSSGGFSVLRAYAQYDNEEDFLDTQY